MADGRAVRQAAVRQAAVRQACVYCTQGPCCGHLLIRFDRAQRRPSPWVHTHTHTHTAWLAVESETTTRCAVCLTHALTVCKGDVPVTPTRQVGRVLFLRTALPTALLNTRERVPDCLVGRHQRGGQRRVLIDASKGVS